MLKTWLRRDRERVRRNLGHCVKAPPKFTDQQWASLRRYWESSGYKLKSEKMSQARGKVMFHPRVGRDGYAGKKAKLRREQDNSSGLADVANVMKRVREGPLSALTETRNSNRLSEMERMHVETNKRIDDVVKSNLDLKDMLKSVLTTLTSCNRIEDTKLVSTDTPVPGSTSTKKVEAEYNREGQSGGSDSSEKWLDLLGKSSDDEPHENALAAGGSSLNRNSAKKGRNANGKSVPLNTTGAVGRNKALEIKSSPPRNISDTQVEPGDKVWLADPLVETSAVGKGRVLSVGGQGSFHNRPIPAKYVRINLEEVVVNLPLMVPREEADQVNLQDAVGSSVLWFQGLTFIQK